MSNTKNGKGGVGFLTLLGLLFIGLKLAGFIDWPWWLVLLPIWAQAALILACVLIVGAVEIYREIDKD